MKLTWTLQVMKENTSYLPPCQCSIFEFLFISFRMSDINNKNLCTVDIGIHTSKVIIKINIRPWPYTPNMLIMQPIKQNIKPNDAEHW